MSLQWFQGKRRIKYVLCLVSQWCLTLCDPTDCNPPGSSVHGDSPGKNIGIGCHALLQGIFPTQGSCNAGDLGSIPGLGKARWRGHVNPLQYSCLENPHGQKSLVGYSPEGHKESDITERLSTAQSILTYTNLTASFSVLEPHPSHDISCLRARLRPRLPSPTHTCI